MIIDLAVVTVLRSYNETEIITIAGDDVIVK